LAAVKHTFILIEAVENVDEILMYRYNEDAVKNGKYKVANELS
jgi:hypothetical protein